MFTFTSIYAQVYRGGFVYNFHDASVPPQYHRSYMIDVEDTVVKFIVDSYEDILFEETFSITGKQLDEFIKGVKACKLRYGKGKVEPKGCTGGTSDSFFFLWNGETPQDGYTGKCGGKDYGNVKGNVEKLRELFKSMVPDFKGKMERTRN